MKNGQGNKKKWIFNEVKKAVDELMKKVRQKTSHVKRKIEDQMEVTNKVINGPLSQEPNEVWKWTFVVAIEYIKTQLYYQKCTVSMENKKIKQI